MPPPSWDHETDVVVVGSGAGGMAAALTARHGGLDVLVVEKAATIGGSTALSGGTVWVPLSDGWQASGVPDSRDAVWTYLHHVVGAAGPEEQRRVFLDAGPLALRFLQRHAGVRFAVRAVSPDYHPDRPGAAPGGRSLNPAEFDGRRLGRRRFRELRGPLPEFTVLGGMMVDMTDVGHLLAVTRSFASLRYGLRLVARHAVDRARSYGRGTRLVLGNALAGQLFLALVEAGVPYWLRTPVTGLLRDGGRVSGVQVVRGGRTLAVRARRGVVLATGGFPWDEAMRARHLPAPTGPYSMAPEENSGDGIALAREAGAVLGEGHASPAFWSPVSVLEQPDGSVVRYCHLAWDRAKPGLLAVDARGRRFVNEAASYHEFVRGMHRAHAEAPAIPAVLVCDSDFVERWGLGLALPGGRPRRHLEKAGYLVKAATLNELARRTGVDPAGLADTVERFNTYAERGVDPEFGKGGNSYNVHLGDPGHRPNPCLGPVRKPPFYAVKVFPGDIGTALGIRADGHARALDGNGRAIPGLYVAGNDMHSVMGGEYPAPGITLGPALTFGWLAGLHLSRPAGETHATEASEDVRMSTVP